MTTTTYDDVKFRLGDIEANLGTGSDAIIANAISGAYPEVLVATGSSTDDLVRYAVANLAAVSIVTSFLGRDDQSVSNIRDTMVTELKQTADRQIKAIGWKTKYRKANP